MELKVYRGMIGKKDFEPLKTVWKTLEFLFHRYPEHSENPTKSPSSLEILKPNEAYQ